MSGRVMDVAGSGVRLRVPNPIPCGSAVKVETQTLVMTGEVVRCEENGDGFLVGMIVIQTTTVANKESRVIMEA